ncbi:mannosyltransferase family protein [Kineococcus sp. SYSU DK003]|uniref:mannosyltransferase family protein n=1 Tax=Kineococcus sp. SYSU DK003 TaxID=3383124 RepID=UPI003D7E1F5C
MLTTNAGTAGNAVPAWRRTLPDLGSVVVWWLVVVTATTVSWASVPVELDAAYDYLEDYPVWVQSLVRWDSNYYLSIAQHGYTSPEMPAFFPLYPLLVRLVAAVGIAPPYAGIAVSALATTVAVVHLRRLAEDHLGPGVLPRRAVTLFLAGPAALFLAAVYTEALFCALAFGAFSHARRGQWARACLYLGLLTATRLPAVVVVAAVFVDHVAQNRRLSRSTLWFALAPLGLLAYLAYSARELGDPLAFLHAYDNAWTYQVFDPNVAATVFGVARDWVAFFSAPGGPDVEHLFRDGLGLFAWLFCLVVTCLSLRRQPVGFTVLSFGTLLFVALNSNLQAVNRYVLVLFPVLLAVTGWRFLRPESRFTALVFASGGVMVLCAVLFTHAEWVG